MEKASPRFGYQVAAPLVSVLICLYFLCPYVYFTPWLLIYGRHWKPPQAVLACFWPVIYLGNRFPAYARFLNGEARLLGLS